MEHINVGMGPEIAQWLRSDTLLREYPGSNPSTYRETWVQFPWLQFQWISRPLLASVGIKHTNDAQMYTQESTHMHKIFFWNRGNDVLLLFLSIPYKFTKECTGSFYSFEHFTISLVPIPGSPTNFRVLLSFRMDCTAQ